MLRSHPDDRELLMAVDGELPRRRQAIVDEHLSACLPCRSRRDEIRTTLAAAGDLYRSAFEPPLPSHPSSRVRLEHALRQAADDWNQSWVVRLRHALAVPQARGVLGVAVVALLVAIVWVSGAGVGHMPATEPGAPLPIATLTPGAVSTLTATELCAGARPSVLVTAESRARVLRAYGMETVSTRTYELDALITPELGGTTAPENLWPQRYASPVWNARVKDELEDLLPRLVCSHQLGLAQAQRQIATDWIAAYKAHFRTDVPLRAHIGTPVADDDALEFAGEYVTQHHTPMVLSAMLVRP